MNNMARVEIGYPRKCVSTFCEPTVIINGEQLTYFDEFGCKTTVKRYSEDESDYEKALCYAILKSMGIKPKYISDLLNKAIVIYE